MDIFIGIDESINSTGITIEKFQDNQLLDIRFYIVHDEKLTRQETAANNSIDEFQYLTYKKYNKKDASDNSTIELFKLKNNIQIAEQIMNIINKSISSPMDHVYIAMEGTSFGSSNTNSLVELGGLSFLIRYFVYRFFKNNEDHLGGMMIFSPKEIKKFATGNGNANKEIMTNLYVKLYPRMNQIKKLDDIADSYWICAYLKFLYNQDLDLSGGWHIQN